MRESVFASRPCQLVYERSLSFQPLRHFLSLFLPTFLSLPLYFRFFLFLSQTLLQRYFALPEKLTSRLAAARYASLPLANLGADPFVAMADAFLGRLLAHNRHVLWASEAGCPDLGGSEGDEHGGGGDNGGAPAAPVGVPGAYRGVCVEIEVRGGGVALNQSRREEKCFGIMGFFSPCVHFSCVTSLFLFFSFYSLFLFLLVSSHMYTGAEPVRGRGRGVGRA